MVNIGVFCSANANIGEEYHNAAVELGTLIGKEKNRLVYGGTMNGLMGDVARATIENGGKVRGVVPLALERYCNNGEIIVGDLHERLSVMTQNSDGFIALAGGVGTLHEIFDVLASKQIGIINKPFALVNTNGCYDNFDQLIKRLGKDKFISGLPENFYFLAENSSKSYKYIMSTIDPSRANLGIDELSS